MGKNRSKAGAKGGGAGGVLEGDNSGEAVRRRNKKATAEVDEPSMDELFRVSSRARVNGRQATSSKHHRSHHSSRHRNADNDGWWVNRYVKY